MLGDRSELLAKSSRGLRQILRALLVVALALPAFGQNSLNFSSDSGIPMPPVPAARGPYSLPEDAEIKKEFREGVTVSSRDPIRTEDNVGYAAGRTIVEYDNFRMEADRMVIDYLSGDIQAEGNVIFRGPDEFIRAKAGRFNIVKNEGIAYGVNGQVQDLFFRSVWDERKKGPSLRQIDENLSLFRGMRYTGCDFPVPHYYITATEVQLLRNKRVYFRNPVLWVRGTPVLWLPFYTRSLGEGSPWWIEFGYNSRLGAFLRIGYRYIHKVQTPGLADPTKYEARSHGLADTYVDLMTNRGVGVGTRYRYQFDYHRHTGYLEVYGLRDTDRNVDESANEERWVYRHKHNSLLTDDLMFQLDVDQASDPDVYWDVLDRFAPSQEMERGRLFEQRTRAALTHRTDNSVRRLWVEERERLSRDINTDFSDPFADDLDFDPDPNFTDGNEYDKDGLSRDRYATVSERVQGRWASRLLNIGKTPLYYRYQVNGFDSLDAGFNQHSPADDGRVYGVDAYNSVTHRTRIGERTTWLNTVGVGGALYDRESNELVTNDDFLNGTPDPNGFRVVDTVRYRDRQTVGVGQRWVDARDVKPFYGFGDYTSRLNHRFSDSLDGFLQYQVRKGTNDSLGEFYESVGRREVATDVYDFYSDRHWVEGGLNYYLRYPNLTTSLTGGHNLQSKRDIFANEQTNFASLTTNYANDTNEFRSAIGTTYETRQIRDRTDENEYEQGSIGPFLSLAYFPRHARYWAQLDVSSSFKTQDDPVDRDARQKRRFDENETDVSVSPTLGKQFGPKYRVQLSGQYTSRYDTWRTAGVTILRDLHDAELGLFLCFRNNSYEARHDDSDKSDDSNRAKKYEAEIKGSLRFKISRDQPGLGARSITTLSDLRQEGQFVQ